MHLLEELDSISISRLGKQGRFLHRIHQADLAKNLTSHDTTIADQFDGCAAHGSGDVWRGKIYPNVANLVMLTASSFEPKP